MRELEEKPNGRKKQPQTKAYMDLKNAINRARYHSDPVYREHKKEISVMTKARRRGRIQAVRELGWNDLETLE
jgi:anthranilate/para-aminobenzoate synthase component II